MASDVSPYELNISSRCRQDICTLKLILLIIKQRKEITMSFKATIKLSDNTNGLISKTNIYESHGVDCDTFVQNVWSLADRNSG